MIQKKENHGKTTKTVYGQQSGTQKTFEDIFEPKACQNAEEMLGIDFQYAKDNGFVNGNEIDDEAIENSQGWRLDEDGNWPEVEA